MKNSLHWAVGVLLAVSLAGLVAAQDYPQAPKPTPKATKTPAASTPTPDATPDATATPGTTQPQGPLKMIKTDGKNKESPIKVTALNYYDSGYGKYNAEVRVSCSIQNAGKDELKKVTLKLQIINGDKLVIQEWKQPIGVMKPNQVYNYNPGVWYNSQGIMLQGKVEVEHEEVPKKDDKAKAKGG